MISPGGGLVTITPGFGLVICRDRRVTLIPAGRLLVLTVFLRVGLVVVVLLVVVFL